MWFPAKYRHRVWSVALALGCLAQARLSQAQDLPRVSASRKLLVAGVGVEQHGADLLGISRIKFQGLIASELSRVGYRVASIDEAAASRGEAAPLTLTGSIREEICDDIAPSQCRIAILWELQDQRGVTVYRALTRAVEQRRTLEELRRALITEALHSLLKRRRFALQLTENDAARGRGEPAVLGFKQCSRPPLELPRAARSASSSMVLVESGSNLALGSIISGDGLILTSAKTILPSAPLRVRFSANQTLPGEVAAIDRAADVALVHVAVATDKTCLPIGDGGLAAGTTVFGVSSELADDVAVSLSPGVVMNALEVGGRRLVQVEPHVARADGGPLLDGDARIVGVTVAGGRAANDPGGVARAVEVASVLRTLKIKPAAISDPRLIGAQQTPPPAVSYVRDHDDPPFALTKLYTYGTSQTARGLRTVGFVVSGAAALGVATTWLAFRGSPNMSPAAHQRTVELNDLSWVLLGLGVAGIGVSLVWPEGHQVVEGHGSARRGFFVRVGASGLGLGDASSM